jgi:hypothetical protein
MFRVASVSLILVVSIAGLAYPQTQAKQDFDLFWHEKIVEISYSGLGLQLQVNGNASSVPFLRPELRNLLNQFPSSKASLASYDTKYVLGQTLLWTGAGAAMVAAGIGIAQSNNPNPSPALVGTLIGVVIAGAAVELWGAGTILGSYRGLTDAVNQYNKEQLRSTYLN